MEKKTYIKEGYIFKTGMSMNKLGCLVYVNIPGNSRLTHCGDFIIKDIMCFEKECNDWVDRVDY